MAKVSDVVVSDYECCDFGRFWTNWQNSNCFWTCGRRIGSVASVSRADFEAKRVGGCCETRVVASSGHREWLTTFQRQGIDD